MRLSSKEAREFARCAASFGWTLEGVTSNGHLRWEHPEYGDIVTGATPTSWRWAYRDLYDAMGRPMPIERRNGQGKRKRKRPGAGVNPVNRLLALARQGGHPMRAEFAEKLLADSGGDLAQAEYMLSLLLRQADRVRARREQETRIRQPWHPRPPRDPVAA